MRPSNTSFPRKRESTTARRWRPAREGGLLRLDYMCSVDYRLEDYNRNMETVNSPAEQRVVLHNIGWGTYERLLADHENNSAPRFTYDRGELEIMSPSPEHEKFNRRIAQLVLAVAEELGIEAEEFWAFRHQEDRRYGA